MVQANKTTRITFLVCAVRIISGTARKYIVSGRNACDAAAVNVGAVALDEVDFYIGDFVFIYAAFLRTGQFNDRVTDGDDGKVSFVRSRLLVECNADFQTEQFNIQGVSILHDLQLYNRTKVDIDKA